MAVVEVEVGRSSWDGRDVSRWWSCGGRIDGWVDVLVEDTGTRGAVAVESSVTDCWC